jgi:uncharacterized protein with PIN domain
MATTFLFHGDLPSLLRRKWKGNSLIVLSMDRRASIKDVLESFGLPHTEVGSIELQGQGIDFTHIVEDQGAFTIRPVSFPWDVSLPTVLRPQPLPTVSFIVDVNVGRLARYLRAAGFDALYDHRWNDEYIAELVREEKRILLTRDMLLLMRKQVTFGRYIRATKPVDQLHEVLGLFGLTDQLAPFTRCLECNSMLQAVSKEEILHRLEPLTRKYYTTFSRCSDCDRIYWPGSHIEKMRLLFSDQFKT